MKRITLTYDSGEGKDTEFFDGKDCGYRIQDGMVSAWHNTPEKKYTRIVPVHRIYSLVQENA